MRLAVCAFVRAHPCVTIVVLVAADVALPVNTPLVPEEGVPLTAILAAVLDGKIGLLGPVDPVNPVHPVCPEGP
jgi:hypothetical protein